MGGYRGIGPEAGTFVPKEKAFDYALGRCLSGLPDEREEFREMLVEWYYSSAITKDEQLEVARLLIKAGYTVSITAGKAVNGKGKRYINYERT